MNQFEALAEYCRQQTLREFDLSFLRIEQIIAGTLKKTALRPQYWSNTVGRGNAPREALRHTPYDMFLISGSKRVRFERVR